MSKVKKTHKVAASITQKTYQRIDILAEEMFDSGELVFLNRSAVVELLLDLGFNTYRMMHPRTDVDQNTADEIDKHAAMIVNRDG